MVLEFFKIITFRSKGFKKSVGIIIQGFFSIPFIIGEVVVFFLVLQVSPIPVVLEIVLQVVVLYVFFKAIKARTKLGRETLDKIEGFKMFLTTTEEKRYELMHQATPLSLTMYERFLPYAIALDVEVPWTNSFKKQIEAAAIDNSSSNMSWYSSSSAFTAGAFSSSMSGLSSGISSSISSASVSSSSGGGGGGGGGGSGGGGGGGGGGGL